MAKSNVELVIRARNEASNALRTISSAIQEVVGDQRELSDQAGSTESRLGELGHELAALNSNFKALRGVSQLATDLSKSEQALRKQTAAAQSAQLEYTQLAKSVSDTERPTKRMTNQLGASERRLQRARDKTAELQTRTAELREEYTRAAEGAGALGADQTQLANLTQRAAAEFAELQTRLRETRNLSKGALSGVTEGLDIADLTVAREALEGVQRSVREAGEAADLSQVDLKALRGELDQLESTASSLGQLRELAATFGVMRRESRDLLRAFNASQQRTEELAREFAAAEAPSRELGEALGRSRAETSRLANDYEVMRDRVSSLGNSLREAGVDVSRLGTRTGNSAQEMAQFDEQIEQVSRTLAESRIEMDRLSDAQQVQAREAQEAARLRAEAEARAQQAAQEAEEFERQRQANLQNNARREYEAFWRNELEKRDEAERTAQARIAEEQRTTDEIIRLNEEAAARQRQAAQEAEAFEQQRQANLRENQRREYENFWQGALDQRDAMRANAQATAEAGRAMEQSGDAVDEASVAYRNAAAQVERMADAHRAAESRVTGLREEQAQVAQKVEETGAAYREAEASLSRLAGEIEQSRAPSRALVDEFEAAKDELKQLEGAFKSSQKELKSLDQALGKAEGALSGIADEFQKAQERASSLEGNFNEVNAAYENLAGTLRDSRDDTEAVAAAQQRLEKALEGSAAELKKTGSAAERAERRVSELANRSDRATQDLRSLGGAAERTGQGMDTLANKVKRAEVNMADFRDQGRTTLSLMQRLRGQVLALTSAYVGLYGVGSGIRGIVDANIELEATQARLSSAVGGDAQLVGEELEFVRQVSDELRLSFREMSSAYGRFAAAARIAGASAEETRAVFLGLSKAARVNKLSGDQLTRAFRAVEQIFSQGKVQAEELREQLADAGLPGVVGMLAAALDKTGGELDKMLEQGEIGAKALIPLVVEMEKRFGPGLQLALQSTSASIGDLQTQIYDIQLLIGESGFLESFADALDRVVVELEKPGIREGMQQLGAGMGQAAVYAVQLLDHLDGIVLIFKLLGTAVATKWLANLVAGLGTALQSLRAFTRGAGMASAAMKVFYGALVGVAFFLAAWSIAEWAAKEFPAFGRYWYQFRRMLELGLNDLRRQFEEAWVAIAAAFRLEFSDVFAWFAREVSEGPLLSLLEVMSVIRGRGRGMAGDIRDALTGWADGNTSGETEKALAEVTAKYDEAAERIKEKWRGVFEEMNGAGQDRPEVTPSLTPEALSSAMFVGSGLSVEDFLDGVDWEDESYWRVLGGDAGEAAGSEMADKMAGQLEQVRERLAQLSAETLEERLALIRSEFDDLIAYLESSGNQAGLDSVNELVGLLEEQERANFQKEKQRELEEEVNDLLQFRRDLMDRIEFLRSQGDAGSIEAAGQLEDKLEGVNTQLDGALEKAIAYARELGNESAVVALQRQRDALVEVQDKLLDAEQINQRFASGAASAFMQVGTEIGKVIDGTQSWSDAFRNAGDAFRKFAADFLQQIAEMILQAAILNAITGSPGGGGGGIGEAIAGLFHTGGVVGSPGGESRAVPAAWFQNATRYHDGGVAGLKPGEVPAILERGEEVLTRDDPRHATNGGKSNQQPVRIINTFDAGEMVSAGLATPAGERVIMNFMSRNRQKIKSTLG